ncbi:hypothetical protein [Flavobacterium sp.]|jgi:hypothetical protein|uniref:hypothetical protein n=1 Tax=Flavobacterium sp. TaxID=239 RepID=UPI0037C04F8F
MKKFKFELKNGTIKEMDIDELTRWACLIEGIEQVSKKYEELGESMDTDDWIKPLAFQKYLEERFHSMKHDLTVEATLGRI